MSLPRQSTPVRWAWRHYGISLNDWINYGLGFFPSPYLHWTCTFLRESLCCPLTFPSHLSLLFLVELAIDPLVVQAVPPGQLEMILQMKLVCQACPKQFKVKSPVPLFVFVSYSLSLVVLANDILHHHFQEQCLGVYTPAGGGGKETPPLLLCLRACIATHLPLPTSVTASKWHVENKTNQNLVVEREWHDHYDLNNLNHSITLQMFFLFTRAVYMLTIKNWIIINIHRCFIGI